jgi:prolyl-tRNA synthetase
MAHSDNSGLVLPPKIAPLQVVIVPIFKGDEQLAAISNTMRPVIEQLKDLGISVKYDDTQHNRPGWKFAEYELQGVPVRIAVGARDLENNVVEVARRDTKEKMTVSLDGISFYIKTLLDEIQIHLFEKAKNFRADHTTEANSWEEFVSILDGKGGFVSAHWDGTAETENKIKEIAKATIRCIPYDGDETPGQCILTGAPSARRVLFARAY